jgi:transposase-like protein
MPRRKYPDYDWVAVHRFWAGRANGLKLNRQEKAEIVRLMLRDGRDCGYFSQRFGMNVDALWRWVRDYRPRALEVGLSEPLRFQFLPEEAIPSDAWLTR